MTTIIIGGGPAGISAAAELEKNGVKYTLLEARDHLGGRVSSVAHNGVFLEYGAAWFHDFEHNEVARLIEHSDLNFSSTLEGSPALYDRSGKIPANNAGDKVSKYLNSLPKETSLADAAPKLYSELSDPVELRAAKAEINLGPLAQGLPLSQISAKPQPPAGSDHAVNGGFQNIVLDVIGKNVNKSNVHLNTKVSEIKVEKGKVVVTTSNGVFEGTTAIVAVPAAVLKAGDINFAPKLDSKISNAVSTLESAKIEKVYLSFDDVFWDNKQTRFLVSDETNPALVWNFGAVHSSKDKGHLLTVLVTSELAAKVNKASDDQLFELVKPVLQAIVLEGSNLSKPTWVSRSHWSVDPHALGAFSVVPLGHTREELSSPFSVGSAPLFFAGEHATVSGAALVQGAYLSGIRAAGQAIEYIKHTN